MPEPAFRRGDVVRFYLGTRFARGQIREDRGPIRVRGRHLYLVEFRSGPQSASLSFVELPADELQSVHDPL